MFVRVNSFLLFNCPCPAYSQDSSLIRLHPAQWSTVRYGHVSILAMSYLSIKQAKAIVSDQRLRKNHIMTDGNDTM